MQHSEIPDPKRYKALCSDRLNNSKVLKKEAKLFARKDKPRKERGYGYDWEKLRNNYIASNPYCEECDRKGLVHIAEEVDHIVPFKGVDDPNRLDRKNLQSLCQYHHIEKTRSDRSKKRRGKYNAKP